MKNTKQPEYALIFDWNGYIPFCPSFVQLSKKYSKCGKSSSDRSWPAWQKLVGHLFLPRIDVISAIELNRHTPKWNLHVKQKGIWRHWGHRENKENQDCDMPLKYIFFLILLIRTQFQSVVGVSPATCCPLHYWSGFFKSKEKRTNSVQENFENFHLRPDDKHYPNKSQFSNRTGYFRLNLNK